MRTGWGQPPQFPWRGYRRQIAQLPSSIVTASSPRLSLEITSPLLWLFQVLPEAILRFLETIFQGLEILQLRPHFLGHRWVD